MATSSDDGQEPIGPSGVFRQLDDSYLYVEDGSEQRDFHLLVINDAKYLIGEKGLEITGPTYVCERGGR